MTSKLNSRLEYLWRSCCCDIASQSDLFRLTYATELLKDLGWDSVVLSDDRWQKLITKKPMLTGTPTFYVTQSALTMGFSDEVKPVNVVCFGDWAINNNLTNSSNNTIFVIILMEICTLYVIAITVGYGCNIR